MKDVFLSKDNIKFDMDEHTIEIEWSSVKHLFLRPKGLQSKYAVFIEDKNGNKYLCKKRNSFRYDFLDKCYVFWKAALSPVKESLKYEYPKWLIRKDQNFYLLRIIALCIMISLLLLLPFLRSTDSDGLRFISPKWIFIYIIALLPVCLLAYLCIFKRKFFEEVNIKNSTFQVSYKNSESEYSFSDIDKMFTSAFGVTIIKFKNGRKLVGLEKLSYWPILKEHLSEKIKS